MSEVQTAYNLIARLVQEENVRLLSAQLEQTEFWRNTYPAITACELGANFSGLKSGIRTAQTDGEGEPL